MPTEIVKSHKIDCAIYSTVVAIFIILFAAANRIYLQDLTDWTYQAWLFSKHLSGEPVTAYTLKLYPVPNSTITVLMGLLGLLVPIVAAEKIVVALTLLGWGILIHKLARLQSEAGYLYGILCFLLLALSSNFWSGYLNFNISALVWGYFLYKEKNSNISSLLIICIALLLFFTHAITYALFVFYLICTHKFRSIKYLIPSLALAAWYLIARLDHQNAESITLIDPLANRGFIGQLLYRIYTVLKLGPFQNFLLKDGQSFFENHHLLYWAAIFLSSAFIAIITFTIVSAAIRSGREQKSYRLFLCVAPVSLLLPPSLLGVVNPAERILFLYLIFGLTNWRWPTFQTLNIKYFLAVSAGFFLTYDATVIACINIFHKTEIGASSISKPINSIFESTQLPYFSHALFSGIEKFEDISANRQGGYVFPSGLWLNKNANP